MNVLLLSDDMLLGGVARHITDIANALYSEGHKVLVAATDGPARSKLNPKIEYLPLFLKNNESMKSNYFGFIPSYLSLEAIIKSNKFDIIHSHKRYAHALGKILSKKHKIPQITSYQNVFSDKRYLSFYGNKTICCSNAIKESLRQNCHGNLSNVITMYYGITPFCEKSQLEINYIRKSLFIPESNIVIGSIGQFVPSKDRETLLYAIYELKKIYKNKNVTVIILGYGPQKEMLQHLCKQLELEETVHFVDGTNSTEDLCNVSDFMILNSVEEGFGIVLLEAASVGKPHIASNIGGIPEFITDYFTGILVPPKNPVVLAQAMKLLLENKPLRIQLGKNAKNKYEQSFTFGKMMVTLMNIYQSVLRK